MTWVAVAVVGGAVVGGVASTVSAKESAAASKAAATGQEALGYANIDLQKELADTQREDFAPWRDVGAQALEQMWSGVQSGAFDVGTVDVTSDPGYQFRMDQGVDALDSSAAARGRLLSGAQQKGVTDYSQNVASQEYANAYARQSNEKANQYNMLSGLSQAGQSSAAGQAQATSQLATSSADTLSSIGQSNAAATIAAGNARAGAYTDTAQGINQAAQNWLTYSQTS